MSGRESGRGAPLPKAAADALEVAPAAERRELEGWVPELAGEDELREALEHAFDYRGDIRITRKDGAEIEGYVFDRREGKTLAECRVRLLPKEGGQKVTIPYSDVARLAFTGRDMAAGKSWEAWVRKYWEKKAAGETNIALHPETLD
jgi:hypothetical protein